jgi:hypothetical protein
MISSEHKNICDDLIFVEEIQVTKKELVKGKYQGIDGLTAEFYI